MKSRAAASKKLVPAKKAQGPKVLGRQAPPARLRRTVPTTKVSVSIETEVHDWLVRKVKAEKTTLSALVTDAIKNLARDEARDRVLEHLGEAAAVTPAERRRIEAEWG
jgi:post-segregation antitoxin (ccd killing protein)